MFVVVAWLLFLLLLGGCCFFVLLLFCGVVFAWGCCCLFVCCFVGLFLATLNLSATFNSVQFKMLTMRSSTPSLGSIPHCCL